jgi:hypothetical protein
MAHKDVLVYLDPTVEASRQRAPAAAVRVRRNSASTAVISPVSVESEMCLALTPCAASDRPGSRSTSASTRKTPNLIVPGALDIRGLTSGCFGGVTIDPMHQQPRPPLMSHWQAGMRAHRKSSPNMRRCNINGGRRRRNLLTAAGVTTISMANVDARMTPCSREQPAAALPTSEPHVSSIPMSHKIRIQLIFWQL